MTKLIDGKVIAQNLRNELKEELIEYIFDIKFYGDNILDVKIVKKYVQDFLDDNHDNEWGVWHIYAWQKWAYSHKLISQHENNHFRRLI